MAVSVRQTSLVDELLLGAAADGRASSRTFPVFNPASGVCLAEVPDMGSEQTLRAIELAKDAFPGWAARTAKERARVLRRWYELVLAHQEELAILITLEQGKPLVEARGEVLYGASFIEWFAEEGKRAYGDVIPTHAADKRLLVLKQPIGVVGAITPWNFPNAMVTRKAAPALAAGCTMVLKPAEDTPLSALALALLAQRAGIPDGVLNVVTCSRPEAVAGALTASADVRKLSFTGSTRVGKLLMEQCAGTVKKLSLELGGNAPFIVFEDADLDLAVRCAVIAKYRNAGQTCVCPNRILVQSSVMDAFADKLSCAVKSLSVGDGMNANTVVGPLINAAALSKVSALVEGAVSRGAGVLLGGTRHELGGNFYRPTVLSGITPDMDIAREEIFGPVATLFGFETEEQAIGMANDTTSGLVAYFFARDFGRIWRVAEALEYGMVVLNEASFSSEATPFGGMKQSGIGREGSRYGLDEYVEIKYVCLGGLSR